jgi:hypothetical protein
MALDRRSEAYQAYCPHHVDTAGAFDRRRLFGALGLVGAGLTLPFGRIAFGAGGTDALLLNCIDYRLTGATTQFMDKHGMAGKYDQIVLAGAALGAKNDKFPDWGKTFRDHVQVALDLHHIHKIVIIDHRDCGAYKVILGEDLASNPKKELEVHAKQMHSLKDDIAKKYPQLGVEMYLMALNGSAESVA